MINIINMRLLERLSKQISQFVAGADKVKLHASVWSRCEGHMLRSWWHMAAVGHVLSSIVVVREGSTLMTGLC